MRWPPLILSKQKRSTPFQKKILISNFKKMGLSTQVSSSKKSSISKWGEKDSQFGVSKRKYFEISFRFISTQNCFVLIFFRFVIQAIFSLINRERLDSSRMTNMLYTRAALNTPSNHLPSPREFSMEDDGTDE